MNNAISKKSLKKSLMASSLLFMACSSLASSDSHTEDGTGALRKFVRDLPLSADTRYLHADELMRQRKMKGSAGWAYTFQAIAGGSGILAASLLGTGTAESGPILGLERRTVEFVAGTVAASTASASTYFTRQHNSNAAELTSLREKKAQLLTEVENLAVARFGREFSREDRAVLMTELQIRLDAHAITNESWYGSAFRTLFWGLAHYRTDPR
jgi:hypothetical protein